MIERHVKRLALLQREFEGVSEDKVKLATIKNQLAEFMEKTAGKYMVFQLLNAAFRLTDSALQPNLTEAQRQYYIGQRDQALKDLNLPDLIKKKEATK